MNDKIKAIIENNLGNGFDYETKEFKIFLIEICQEQINECAKHDVVPINYKNIAE